MPIVPEGVALINPFWPFDNDEYVTPAFLPRQTRWTHARVIYRNLPGTLPRYRGTVLTLAGVLTPSPPAKVSTVPPLQVAMDEWDVSSSPDAYRHIPTNQTIFQDHQSTMCLSR